MSIDDKKQQTKTNIQCITFHLPKIIYYTPDCDIICIQQITNIQELSYFSFQLVLHDWYNKGLGMCYPVCGMVHIKEPLLLIRKSSPYVLLSEWSFTICLTPYNRK